MNLLMNKSINFYYDLLSKFLNFNIHEEPVEYTMDDRIFTEKNIKQ